MVHRKNDLSKFKLDILLDITQLINKQASTDQLLNLFKDVLTNNLKVGKIVIFKHNKTWDQILISGITEEKAAKLNINKLINKYSEIALITNKIPPFDFIIPVFKNKDPLAYILIGDLEEEGKGISPAIKHLPFIHTISNIIIIAMENIKMYKELIVQERINKEMELASQIQNLLIPSDDKLPQNKHISTLAYYEPHYLIGGDYYDFIPFGEDEIGFCIADVSGKGISAALIMANFQATIQALFKAETPLEELIITLNKTVCQNTKSVKFLTLFIAKYNYKTRILEYINSSHYPPILYNYESKEFELLKKGCVGLGMLDELPAVEKGVIKIEKHSKLLCYTDGIVELETENIIRLELNELQDLFASDNNLNDTFKQVNDYIKTKKESKSIIDDISLFAIEFHI